MNSLPQQFPWRIFFRIAVTQAVLVFVAILSSGLAARYFFREHFVFQSSQELNNSLTVLSRNIDDFIPPDWCRKHVENTYVRLAALRYDGTVICDSSSDTDPPEKHMEFSEFKKAIQDSIFHSRFEGDHMYGALPLPAQRLILRGSIPVTWFTQAVRVFDASLGVILGVIGIMLILAAFIVARRLVFPLGRLLVKTRSIATNPNGPLKEDLGEEAFGEWSDLESNIDDLRKKLEKTAQHLSIEQVELDTLMAAISDAVLAVDPEGVPLFYNSRFEMSFPGFNRQKKFWEIFRDPEILETFRAALDKGRNGSTRAIPWEGDKGKRYFTLSVSPLRRQGILYGAMGIFHDVTELKSAEQMRIDFVANVSHELRTPLTSIKGYTETAMQDVSAQPEVFAKTSIPEFLTIISRNATRLMNLMGDLIDLSSIESTEILQKEILRTSEITTRVLKQLEPRFQARKQSVELDFQAPMVFADASRLEQVIANLLDNANKYTPEGGNIRVTWLNDKESVLLRIHNSGPGIPKEHHARLFERFYRIDKARSREQGGTGLGLAIVKHILQRHEGSVGVESEQGKGTTFTCRFPDVSSAQDTNT